MFDVQTTELFDQWLSDLTDRRARARITSRIDRLSQGNAEDVKAVGEGVSEMRIDTGPGYRVYYKQTGRTIIVILCGGDKSSQDKDIKKAKQIAAGLWRKRKW
jgi:putative addiction module killer protein